MLLSRNLLFYFAFYLGTAGYVTAAILAAPFGRARMRSVVRKWARYHRDCLRTFIGIRVAFEGTKPDGPALFAIKHESFFEAIDAPAHFHEPVPFAKKELSRIPGWGRAARVYGMIWVARDEGARALRAMLRDARHHTAEGRPLVIFPEGTRVPHGERARLQAGFSGIYKMIRVPVIPVAVDSGPLYHRFLKRAGTITYRYGEPIPPGLDRGEVERRVIEAINALNPA